MQDVADSDLAVEIGLNVDRRVIFTAPPMLRTHKDFGQSRAHLRSVAVDLLQDTLETACMEEIITGRGAQPLGHVHLSGGNSLMGPGRFSLV